MSGWRWSPTPSRRLLDDDRFLELPLEQKGVLLLLYLVCDKNGRFIATKRAFIRATGMLPEEMRHLHRLHELQLLTLYDVAGVTYGELERYSEDAPSELRKSKDDRYPGPGPGHIRPPSGPNPDPIRTPSGPSNDGVDTGGRKGAESQEEREIRIPSGRHPDEIRTPSGIEEKRREERGTKVPRGARAYDTPESVSSQPASETQGCDGCKHRGRSSCKYRGTVRTGVPCHHREPLEIGPTPLSAEREEGIKRFVEEWMSRRSRNARHVPRQFRKKRHGWFGDGSDSSCEAKLRELFAWDERFGDLALRCFWGEVDDPNNELDLRDGVERAIELFANLHGKQTMLAQAMAAMRGEG
jgi:hypothetical protein